MKKQLILFLVLIFSVGCALSSVPFTFPKLSYPQTQRLDELLPKESRQVLEQAQTIELFEIESEGGTGYPKVDQIEQGKFQGYRITKKAIIADENQKSQVLNGLFYGIGSSGGGMGCFSPHHAIRAQHNGERVDLVICFHCGNFAGVSSVGKVGGAISSAPKELFEKVLTDVKEN